MESKIFCTFTDKFGDWDRTGDLLITKNLGGFESLY